MDADFARFYTRYALDCISRGLSPLLVHEALGVLRKLEDADLPIELAAPNDLPPRPQL